MDSEFLLDGVIHCDVFVTAAMLRDTIKWTLCITRQWSHRGFIQEFKNA